METPLIRHRNVRQQALAAPRRFDLTDSDRTPVAKADSRLCDGDGGDGDAAGIARGAARPGSESGMTRDFVSTIEHGAWMWQVWPSVHTDWSAAAPLAIIARRG